MALVSSHTDHSSPDTLKQKEKPVSAWATLLASAVPYSGETPSLDYPEKDECSKMLGVSKEAVQKHWKDVETRIVPEKPFDF